MKILIALLIIFFTTLSYADNCNEERTECTVGFGEFYGFEWTPNHINDNVKGYRIYKIDLNSQLYNEYTLLRYSQIFKGKDDAFFNEDILVDANICERTTVDEGSCSSPPISSSVEGDFIFVVTAVDGYHESGFSNEVIIHVRNVYVPLSKIKNFTIKQE